ncbi:MAG: cation:proton antiporter, partial [Cellulomonadaceae bacterium]|nr:cation:proton antiporter [Cellulomonadaceae bacterium]
LLGVLTVVALLALRAAFLVPVLGSTRRAAARRAATRPRLEWMEQRLADSHPLVPPAHEIRKEGTWGTPVRDSIYRRPGKRRLIAALVRHGRRGMGLAAGPITAVATPTRTAPTFAGNPVLSQPEREKFLQQAGANQMARLQAHPQEHQRFTARIARAIADTDYYLDNPIGPREGLLLVFAGMRGAVTLAAAQSLPRDFPQRSFIVLVAFLVAFISLLLQGSLLPLVVRKLALDSNAVAANEDSRQIHLDLEQVTAQYLDNPGLRRADGQPYSPEVVARVRAHLVHPNAAFQPDDRSAGDYQASYRELWAAALQVQRTRLLADRKIGSFDSEPLEAALTAIDAEEMMIQMKPAAWLADD